MSRSDFEKRLAKVLGKLKAVRKSRKPLIRDDKVLTGWNALMVRALAEAGTAFSRPEYLTAAIRVQTFINKELHGSNGQLKRSYFEGRASLNATQSDYAFAGLSSIALYDATRDRRWLDDAARYATEMADRFSDKAGGGLFLTTQTTGFTRTKDTDDTTIPSGNAAALELYALLRNRTPDVIWKQRVRQLQAGLSGIAATEPTSHSATLLAADIAVRGEGGVRQATAHGAVAVVAGRSSDGKRARVQIRLANGWHINSIAPRQDFLLPTQLRVSGIANKQISYPDPVDRKLGFHNETLSLYEGDVTIGVKLPVGVAGRRAHRITMSVQACSDRICLEPETIRGLIPAVPE